MGMRLNFTSFSVVEDIFFSFCASSRMVFKENKTAHIEEKFEVQRVSDSLLFSDIHCQLAEML